MSEFPDTCPDCGTTLPSGSPWELCPACLMAQALASRTVVAEGAHLHHPPPPSPEEIADWFPGFEILECLGRGGMGVVYRARQKSLNRLVAIKILAPGRESESSRFAGRFAREAELLAKLNHPHIVTIHDFGETGGLFYLVMEFIDGVNLRDLLRDGKLEPEQALTIVPPICEALQYAHGKSIVHRDIKPENLLLDRDGRIKIADFGIASLTGASGESAGTPPYMAPEQLAAASDVDSRADIYALGAVLYEMLTGERPDQEIVAPSKKVEIDVRLDEMVLRALEKNPELRYQTAEEFHTVVETMQPVPVSAGPPSIPASPPRESLKRFPHRKDDLNPAAKQKRRPQSGHWALGLQLLAILAGTSLWDSVSERFLMVSVAVMTIAALALGIKSWKSRSGKVAAVSSGLWMIGWLVLSLGFFGQGSLHRYTSQSLYPRLQIPKDYGGVVVIVYEQPGHPELPIRGKHQVLRLPEDGVLITSSTPRYSPGATRNLQTYNTDTGKIWGGREIICHFGSSEIGIFADGEKFSFDVFEVGDSLYWQGKKSGEFIHPVQQARQRLQEAAERKKLQARLKLIADSPRSVVPTGDVTGLILYEFENGNHALSFPKGTNVPLENSQLGPPELEPIDMLVSFTGGDCKWLVNQMQFGDLRDEEWEGVTRERIEESLSTGSKRLEPLRNKGPWTRFQWRHDSAHLPAIFAFQTASGEQGIVRIDGFTFDPYGMKMRYKLLASPH